MTLPPRGLLPVFRPGTPAVGCNCSRHQQNSLGGVLRVFGPEPRGLRRGSGDHQAGYFYVPVCGAIRVVVCPWAPAVRRPRSPCLDTSPVRPTASLSVSQTPRARPEPKASCPSPRAHSLPDMRFTCRVFIDTVLLAWHLERLGLGGLACVCLRATPTHPSFPLSF